MNNSLYKCPICGGPTTFSSMIFQPQPCLHCRATLKTSDEHEKPEDGNVKDPFYFKGYWYQEYLEMREKFWKQIGENSKLAERIVQLRAALDAMVEGVARKTDSQQADRIRELEEHSSKQDFLIDELADSLRAMVAHCEGFISNLKEGK